MGHYFPGAPAGGDARTAYGGWGIWAAAVVAYAVSGLPQDWAPQDATRRLFDAMTHIDPQWPGIANLHALLQTSYPERSWDAWCQVINTAFAGYPNDHCLPNLLLIWPCCTDILRPAKGLRNHLGSRGMGRAWQSARGGCAQGARFPT